MIVTGAQMRAGRALLRWSAQDLADRAKLGVATVRRAELFDGEPNMTQANAEAIRRALEAAGCIFIAENGEGPGVRLRKNSERQSAHAISAQIETLEAKIADMPAEGEPSPENGMNTMRKAVAENDLVHLKGRRRKSEQK